MHYENANNLEEENVVIHINPFLKETSNLQTRKVPITY